MTTVSISGAFLAGFASFTSSTVLPLVPTYLAALYLYRRRNRMSVIVFGLSLVSLLRWHLVIGPTLAIILASADGREAALLTVYLAGLAVPLLVAAFGVGRFLHSQREGERA
jgi:cytochrome c biogenesis protein CcdA